MSTGCLQLNGKTLIPRVEVADGPIARLVGLLGRNFLPVGDALFLEPCQAVHTVGMRFRLDLVFVDRAWTVQRVHWDVPAGRPCCWGGRNATGVLEAASGWLDRDSIREGATLQWVAAPPASAAPAV